MAIQATVQSVNRVGERVAIGVLFSDNTTKEYTFDLPLVLTDARAAVKADLDRLNTIEGQIDTLKSLIGTVIK